MRVLRFVVFDEGFHESKISRQQTAELAYRHMVSSVNNYNSIFGKGWLFAVCCLLFALLIPHHVNKNIHGSTANHPLFAGFLSGERKMVQR